MAKKTRVALFICCILPHNISAGELLSKAQDWFQALPLESPRQEKLDPFHPQQIILGKTLYFDPRLSASGTQSCNSCHNLSLGGDDNLPTSLGHGWQSSPRNTPTILNSAFNIARFWDKEAAKLELQSMGPIRTGVEWSNSVDHVIKTINSMPQYVKLFRDAFPNDPSPVSLMNTERALDAFKAILVTPSPFDSYLLGNERALSENEKDGLAIFIEKGCVSCHHGKNIGGHDYYPFGVFQNSLSNTPVIGYRDYFVIEETTDHEFIFRAPPLRNVAVTAPYFHAGLVWDLEAAVAIMADAQLGEELSIAEISKITIFLKSLTGIQISFEYPILPVETSSTPRLKIDQLPY